jgi:hypothetical protein
MQSRRKFIRNTSDLSGGLLTIPEAFFAFLPKYYTSISPSGK